MQNRVGKLILKAPYRTPSREVLSRLGWMSVRTLHRQHKAMLVYRALDNSLPPHMRGVFIRYRDEASRSTRQSTLDNLIIPRPQLEVYRRSLSVLNTKSEPRDASVDRSAHSLAWRQSAARVSALGLTRPRGHFTTDTPQLDPEYQGANGVPRQASLPAHEGAAVIKKADCSARDPFPIPSRAHPGPPPATHPTPPRRCQPGLRHGYEDHPQSKDPEFTTSMKTKLAYSPSRSFCSSRKMSRRYGVVWELEWVTPARLEVSNSYDKNGVRIIQTDLSANRPDKSPDN
ncbi:hypothetical protein Bbelb_203470 [Branchiostoma belcheri]|nr:hypothetical protein Bbelb_203470 [Branchiostoma belcheri]